MEAIFATASSGITVAATATALTAVLLPLEGLRESVDAGFIQLRIVNEGPSVVFVATGAASTIAATLPTTTAAKTCDAVLAGSDIVLTLPPSHRYISTICRAAGTGTLTVYAGKGQ
jgi:hypothetical protein